MANFAQQESSEFLNKNIKPGLRFRYQNGELQMKHSRLMGGYTKDDKGYLIIEPNEEEIGLFRGMLKNEKIVGLKPGNIKIGETSQKISKTDIFCHSDNV